MRGNVKIRVKIFILFVCFMIIGIFGSAGLSYIGAKKILIQQTSQSFKSIALSRSAHVKTFLKLIKSRAIDFSSDGKIKDCLYYLPDNQEKCTYEDLTNHLIINKLPVDENLYGVFVLDKNGQVVGTTNSAKNIKKDFSSDPVFLEGKKNVYINDIFFDQEFNHVGIFVSVPVIRANEFVGVIVNRIKPDFLYEILMDRTGIGSTGETYLVNKDGYIISPSRFRNDVILKQKVDTENLKQCFQSFTKSDSDQELKKHEKDEIPDVFIDYRGKQVLATHGHLDEVNWCLSAKIDKNETVVLLSTKLLKFAFLILIAGLIMTIFFICLAGHFIRKIKDV